MGAALVNHSLVNLAERLRALGGHAIPEANRGAVFSTGVAELDAWLPEHGFGPGVTELRAPLARGGGTSLALSTLAALHAQSKTARVAWVDPEGSLYAPAVLQAGVDLQRLLVVRPTWSASRRIACKVAASGAFDLVVVDMHAPGSRGFATDERVVRKLALSGTCVLLLTNTLVSRSVPWPTSLRLELERRPGGQQPESLAITIGKDKLGHVGAKTLVALPHAA
jgi:recA bacterial DNA recombination protein